MMTVIETAKRQGRRVLKFLAALLTMSSNQARRAMYARPRESFVPEQLSEIRTETPSCHRLDSESGAAAGLFLQVGSQRAKLLPVHCGKRPLRFAAG
jgi:hypothetical protein